MTHRRPWKKREIGCRHKYLETNESATYVRLRRRTSNWGQRSIAWLPDIFLGAKTIKSSSNCYYALELLAYSMPRQPKISQSQPMNSIQRHVLCTCKTILIWFKSLACLTWSAIRSCFQPTAELPSTSSSKIWSNRPLTYLSQLVSSRSTHYFLIMKN